MISIHADLFTAVYRPTRAQSMPMHRTLSLAALVVLSGSRALAQDRIEVSLGLWSPRADIVIASDGGGLQGTSIDVRQDAGLTDGHFPAAALTLRVAARHKVRFEYLQIRYDSSATLTHDVNFTGVTYPRGAAIGSTFDWKSYGLGYEYDFLVKPRWTAGLIVEARQTDIQERLSSASATQARRTRVPVPVVGGTVRVDPAKRFSFSAELTGFMVPNSADRRYGGHYLDMKLLGAVDITPRPAQAGHYRLGLQGGYRLVDIFHLGESDSATMTLKGVYFGAVVRR